MASKLQFMDPVSAVCKLILLKLYPPRTKIRIIDHTIQLVPDLYTERMVFRPWYQDSREDMCALYPVIVRFIELFLNEKKYKPHDSKSESDDITIIDHEYNNKYYESLKKLAEYSLDGLHYLQETYGYDNAVFTLKFYSNLLQSSVDGTYTQKMLPNHLKDFTSQNLLDISKIKNLWKDESILHISKLFDDCFEALKNNQNEIVVGYKAAIELFLGSRDDDFKKIISST
jgi:hypothetical protein